MKQVNQLIHATKDKEILKSILKNGLHTSYAKEEFCGENILIPMISFSNVLFRDLGDDELIDYGNYAIVIDRDLGWEKYQLNPVMYVSTNSNIAQSVKNNFYKSIFPQVLDLVKQDIIETKNCCGNLLERIGIKPELDEKVKNLINAIDDKTSDAMIESIKELFADVFENSIIQLLVIKPYKVRDGKGKEWIAYNDREWRKSFFDLNFIREFTPHGEKNKDYEKWIDTDKPHLKDEKYTLKIDLKDIKNIIVEKEEEIEEIETFIKQELQYDIPKGIINTLENLKKIELNNNP